MSRERNAGAGMTLEATALVHEAYLRMLHGREVAWADRRHLFVAAAMTPTPEPDWELLDKAMAALADEDPELAEIVHLRYFAGLNVDAVSQALGCSPRTVDRRWQVARAWLLEWTARQGSNARFLD